MNNFQNNYNKILNAFEASYTEYLNKLKDIPEPLLSAIKYSAELKGKRLRPVLLLAINNMLGGKDQAINFAIALELIHTYSLVHDDLPAMDNDSLRRGKPTSHIVFGEAMAILVGDALLNLAFELMSETIIKSDNPINSARALNCIATASGASGMIAGQCVDIENEKNNINNEVILKYLHEQKTGRLIAASVVSAAILNDADDKIIENLKEYSQYFGLVFQITDDILDVEGDVKLLGKTIGKDEKSDKLTFPKIYGLAKSHELANYYASKAIQCLGNLPYDTEFLNQLVVSIVNRNK